MPTATTSQQQQQNVQSSGSSVDDHMRSSQSRPYVSRFSFIEREEVINYCA